MKCIFNCCNCCERVRVIPVPALAPPLHLGAAINAIQNIPLSSPSLPMRAVQPQEIALEDSPQEQMFAPAGTALRMMQEERYKKLLQQQFPPAQQAIELLPSVMDQKDPIPTPVMVRDDH